MKLYQSGATPLSGSYLVRSPALRAALTAWDGLTSIGRGNAVPPIPARPSSVLVSIGGQLGDAVIATSAIRQLRAAFPSARISVVCPPTARQVFAGHPHIEKVHVADHWFFTPRRRDMLHVAERWRAAAATRSWTSREIAARRYEMAVDLYPFFPNTASLLHAAGVPVRVGYASAGGGPLLTHALPWRDTRAHVAHQHAAVLEYCWPDISFPEPAYDLPVIPPAAEVAGRSLLVEKSLEPNGFVVLHPGTSNPLKRWPTERWIELAKTITGGGGSLPRRVLLTGQGGADSRVIDDIVRAVPAAASACDATDFHTLRYVLGTANAVISADSVASHLAAAAGRPTVSIMTGMSDPEHWKPLGANAAGVTTSLHCSPCFRTRGCESMACVRDVTIDRVLEALRMLRP